MQSGERWFQPATPADHELVWLIERLVQKYEPKTKWEDISGLTGAKMLLLEAMSRPDRLKEIRQPWKSVLMVGPPAIADSLLARAVATECGTTYFRTDLPFFMLIRGEPHQFVRVIQILFEMARLYAPSTIFLGGLSALCSDAEEGNQSENQLSTRQHLIKSEILSQLERLKSTNDEPNKVVMVLAGAHSPWLMDSELRNCFEKRIYIPLLDLQGREQLINRKLRGRPLREDVNLRETVQKLDGYTDNEIDEICREALEQVVERYVDIDSHPGEVPLFLTPPDFAQALTKNPKSVTNEDIQKYIQWMFAFGTS